MNSRRRIIAISSSALPLTRMSFLPPSPTLDTVYVPIGLGSGFPGVIGVRDSLGLKTKVVGVVAQRANAYALSFAAGHVVTTNSALTFADGMAVRVPDAAALAVIRRGAERIVEVSDEISPRRSASISATRIRWPKAPAPHLSPR